MDIRHGMPSGQASCSQEDGTSFSCLSKARRLTWQMGHYPIVCTSHSSDGRSRGRDDSSSLVWPENEAAVR